MNNKYEIRGEVTAIFLRRKNGTTIETLIDTNDLPLVQSIESTWYAGWQPSAHSFYVQGNLKKRMTDPEFRKLTLHRWILGEPDGLYIDHINGNSLDNRRSNLRAITNGQNQQNLHKLRNSNTSGVRGVNWHRRQKKWNARVGVNGKRVNVGSFDTLEEAENAVIEARKKLMPFSFEAWEATNQCNV